MTWQRAVSIAVTALVAGIGAWLTLGAVAPLAAEGSARLGVLPSLWVAGAGTLGVAVLAWITRATSAALRPLLLAALLWLPWLPLPVPASFLLWQGPLAWAVWAAIALLLAWPRLAGAALGVVRLRPAAQAVVAGAIAVAACTAAAWRMAPVLPGGDEPHYLVITQSLLRDGDLRIEDNHRRREYLAYTEQTLKPDFLRRGQDGQIYSIHAPGVSALLLPAFAVGGYPASVVFLALVAAFGTMLVWTVTFRLTGSAGAAWVGWAAVALSPPFFFQSFTVYPDGPGAVLVMTAVWALAQPERLRRASACAWHGTALAALPWLHTRYAVLAAVLGLLLAARVERDVGWWRRLVALFAIPAASAFAWFWSFYAIYGTFNPTAPYGGYTQSSLLEVPGGVTGLLVDQQFGLLPNAPVYLVAFAGILALWRTHRRLAVEIAAFTVPYVVTVASYHMWWGGRSSPARFIVPVLLPLGVAIGARWAGTRCRTVRAVVLVLLATSVALSAALAAADGGALVYNARDGVALWAERAAPLVNLPLALPSFFRSGWGASLALAAGWVALLAATVAVARRWPGATDDRGHGTRAVSACAIALMAGTSAAWTLTHAAAVEPGTALLRVLHGADARRPITVGLPHLRALSRADALTHARVPSASRRPLPAGTLFAARAVPPGQYVLVADSPLRITGAIAVHASRGLPPVDRADLRDVAPGPLPLMLDLPAGAEALTIAGDASAQRTAGQLLLQPLRVSPRTSGVLARAGVRYGSTVAWFLDDGAYAETDGFWVRGSAAVEVALVAPDGSEEVRLHLRNGAAANRVTLVTSLARRDVALAAGEEQDVTVPAQAARGGIRIASAAGFRPADVDPGSSDSRVLGVWVAPR